MIFDLQKASMGKRISAYIFDFILLCVLSVGIAFLLSIMVGYDGYIDELHGLSQQYEEKYGIDLDIKKEDYDKLTEQEKDHYVKADEDFRKNPEVIKLSSMLYNLGLLIVSLPILLAYLILEFMVPIFLHNGQTFGKKIFGVAVMMVNGVKISNVALFVRTVLGKYTIETMIPIFLALLSFSGYMGIGGTIVIGLLGLFQLGLIFFTRTHSAIHDALSSTVTVDMASQMIFDSYDEMIAYKEKAHKESTEKSTY